ncbi:NAD-dependent epimerase/dehydratase family protein [Actinomadura sp. KC216]|uniref:NAD-dependent epimerase/dehydratase family protein n=1 Tax=Actinomadura sp. KC216 TaxID=2530370 RepID=UPI002441E018|nr:NAD-dependent epimerase/dehydratase family protein [Actinomadura sp. KC216]
MTLGTIVLTGAAGRVGSALRTPLRDEAGRLILADRAPLRAEAPNETVHRTDLSDAAEIMDGADAVVHLAGVSDEAPFPDLVEGNISARSASWRRRASPASRASCSPAATG